MSVTCLQMFSDFLYSFACHSESFVIIGPSSGSFLDTFLQSTYDLSYLFDYSIHLDLHCCLHFHIMILFSLIRLL